MTFEHLTSRLDLDAGSYVSEADDAADASEGVASSTDTMSESLLDVDVAGAAAGGALAGLATAAQRSLDSTRENREELARTATQIDATEDELLDMTTSLSDATLSHEEVTGAMREFQGLNVDTREEMERYITAADTIADATGSSADAIANDLAPQVRALDGDLDALEERQDAFVMAAEQSSMSIDEIGRNLGQLDFEPLQEMGVESDEAALAMAEFADKTGLPPRQLRTEFRSAVEESNGDLEQFEENLGLGEGALEELSAEVKANAGIAQEQADAVGDQASTMDRLRARMDDARLVAADYLGPLEALIPAAQAAGVALLGMSTINFSAVIPSITGVGAALWGAGIAPILLGIAAAVTAAYAIWERDLGGIQDKTETAVDAIMGGLEWLVDGLGSAIETADYILTEWSPGDTLSSKRDAIEEPVDDVRDMIPGTFDEATDLASGIFRNWTPHGIIWDKREEIMDALPIPDEWKERGEDLVSGFIDGIRDMAPDVGGAVSDLADTAGEYLPSSDAERGEFSGLTDAGEAIPETIGSAAASNADALASGMDQTTAAGATGDGDSSKTMGGGNNRQRDDEILTRLDQLIETVERLPESLEGTRLRLALQLLDDRELRKFIRDEASDVIVEGGRA